MPTNTTLYTIYILCLLIKHCLLSLCYVYYNVHCLFAMPANNTLLYIYVLCLLRMHCLLCIRNVYGQDNAYYLYVYTL